MASLPGAVEELEASRRLQVKIDKRMAREAADQRRNDKEERWGALRLNNQRPAAPWRAERTQSPALSR
jgi:hypothetical protein